MVGKERKNVFLCRVCVHTRRNIITSYDTNLILRTYKILFFNLYSCDNSYSSKNKKTKYVWCVVLYNNILRIKCSLTNIYII